MPVPVLSQRLVGVLLMLGAMASLPFIDVLAKFLGQEHMPILQIVWARVGFGAIVSLPFALRHVGPADLFPAQPYFHAIRAGLLVMATFCFFLGLKFLPIADTLAIFFVQPLIVTVLSAAVLRERVSPSRWIAVCIGFLGTLIIIRPGFVALNPGSLLALASGLSFAVYLVMARRISGRAPAILTTFQTNAVATVLIGAAMPFVWVTPTPTQWLMMAALGTIATFGHFLIVRAYDFAEASLLAPLAYTEMIMATFVGWWFFNDLPDRYTLLGVTILIACALFISLGGDKKGPVVTFEQP